MLHHIIFNPLFQGFPGKRLTLTMDFTTDIMVQDQRRKKWGGTALQYREYDTEILNRIKDVEKQILCKYIEICEKYHLRYFVAFGTLLGTVRHKGFIPWDDDIDVGMPREDYERFLQIAQKECGEEYFLQTVDTDPKYHLYFAKLRMNRTRFVENSLQKSGSITGFYIDIFPYDEISDDEAEMEKQLNRAVRWGMILSIYKVKEPQIGQYGPAKDFVMRSIWHILHGGMHLCGISAGMVWKKCNQAFMKKPEKGSSRMTTFAADAKKWIIEKKEIEQLVDVPFENITVKIPCGYDAILTRCYGDYMKLPDEKDRVNHMPVEIQFPGEEVMTFGK